MFKQIKGKTMKKEMTKETKVTAINKIEDYYKNHKFIAIPICGDENEEGEFIYDLEAMQDEVDNAFKSLGEDVLCTMSNTNEIPS